MLPMVRISSPPLVHTSALFAVLWSRETKDTEGVVAVSGDAAQ